MINDLAPKHNCGHDGLSANFIKQISGIISGPLTLIINQSLSTGVFPDRLKIAKVIPIFKKGDNHILDIYRPISLLPTVSKLFEKIVFRQLYKYLPENKILFTSQYGFREFHSTELAALELVDRVSQYLDCGKISISVFLDMSKAFDTLDHNILIDKLKFYGLTNTPLNWFRSYSYGRQQYVGSRWLYIIRHRAFHWSPPRIHIGALTIHDIYERHSWCQFKISLNHICWWYQLDKSLMLFQSVVISERYRYRCNV